MLDPALVSKMTKERLQSDARHVRQAKRRERLARLECPDCGDKFKIRFQSRWVCRHCLVPMMNPQES